MPTFPEVLPNDKQITNIILDRSLPDFIRENYPLFEAFLKAYYEWLQLPKQPNDIVEGLREYRDIDRTITEFVDFFRHEFLINIPTNVLADKRLLVKQIKDFYLNKGNENSYKFLFQVLYGENIEIYYPKVDILRASDGKWIQTVTIKIEQGSLQLNDLAFLFNGTLKGLTSNATANVQAITNYNERGIEVLELDIVNLHGNFLPNEQLSVTPDDSNHGLLTVKQIYSTIVITNPGADYLVGDKIEVLNGDSNNVVKIGEGVVKEVGRGPVIEIPIINGGIGYRGLHSDINDFLYVPLNHEYDDSNTSGLLQDAILGDIGNELLSHPIANVTLTDIPDQILVIDSDIIGNGCVAFVSEVSQDGIIEAITISNHGRDYLNPTAVVLSDSGSGAILNTIGGWGAIRATQLNNFPIVENTDEITLNIISANGVDGQGVLGPNNDTSVIRYKGFFANSDGMPSSNKKLEDNDFYQDFSYAILSSITYDKWNNIIGKIVHPAGLKSFGLIKLKAVFDDNAAPTVDLDTVDILHTYELDPAGGVYGVDFRSNTGVYSLVGNNVILHKTSILAPNLGTYTQTGNDAGLRPHHKLVAAHGTYTQTGAGATLTQA